ncbi:DUF427 domain-containing protein [Streptomyces sp. NPDC002055]|uniref:DUF427 domain-containing protein n=1 Tax=Streptomyces sp. NPDC002055 TaxID=3154534 RepID=UPI0033286579
MPHRKHTVEAVPGSQHVRVEIGGQVVAETRSPVLVHETGLPVRYYLPPADVATDRLEATVSSTHCPFKGDAAYWSYRDGTGELREDVVWAYPDPLAEVAAIKDHLCFYDTVADIVVDGVKVAGPGA